MNASDHQSPPKRRGIQLGQVVGAGAPRALESVLKQAHSLVWPQTKIDLAELMPPGWTVEHRRDFLGTEIIKILQQRSVAVGADFDLAGYRPDGGIYSLVDPQGQIFPILTSEAKHQGAIGNAIERWHKNYTITRMLGADVAMLTFATGAGVRPKGPIRRTLNVALAEYAVDRNRPVRQWNYLYAQGPSMFCQEEGFAVAQVADTLKEGIMISAAAFFRN